MKNKTKNLIGVIVILGVFVGNIFNQVLTSYFGSDISNIIVGLAISMVLCSILTLFIMSQYFAAIIMSVLAIPVVVMGVGFYLDNMELQSFGFLALVIICPILTKVIPKLNRKK